MLPGHGPPDVNLSSLALDGSPACKLFIAPEHENCPSRGPCLMGCGVNPNPQRHACCIWPGGAPNHTLSNAPGLFRLENNNYNFNVLRKCQGPLRSHGFRSRVPVHPQITSSGHREFFWRMCASSLPTAIKIPEGVIWGPKWVCFRHDPKAWAPWRVPYQLSVRW